MLLGSSEAAFLVAFQLKYAIALLLAGCGAGFAGEPVPDWPRVLFSAETPEITPALMECAIGFVTPTIAADTRWDVREIQSGMSPAEIHVKSVTLWQDPASGKTIVGEEWEGGPIVVGRDLHALSHEFRHQVAYSLTGDAQGDHPGWTDAYEEDFRAQLEKYCYAASEPGAGVTAKVAERATKAPGRR